MISLRKKMMRKEIKPYNCYQCGKLVPLVGRRDYKPKKFCDFACYRRFKTKIKVQILT